jgi:SAM-dependent methyltransferase
MRASFSGSGPGVQAPDGCSVEVYRRIPYLGELDPLREYLAYGAKVLELGCGTGRFTRRLLEWGLLPTSIDNSPDMLAEIPRGAVPVQADIENLVLTDRFDVALLASCLINHPTVSTRESFVRAAARHLNPQGSLLVERHDPQ